MAECGDGLKHQMASELLSSEITWSRDTRHSHTRKCCHETSSSDIVPSATSPTMADNNEKKVETKPEEEKKKLPQLGALEDDDEFEVSEPRQEGSYLGGNSMSPILRVAATTSSTSSSTPTDSAAQCICLCNELFTGSCIGVWHIDSRTHPGGTFLMYPLPLAPPTTHCDVS